jgi:hypothetical protein
MYVVVMLAGILVGLQKEEETKTASACVAEEETLSEETYILAIPLPCELQEELHEACVEFGVDYYIMVALIDRETKFRNVIGDNGNSYGYCQIQPRWWYDLMLEIGATDLNVPKDNFRTACAIMSGLTKTYQSTEGALVAYNTGSYKGKATAYSREIMANAERYRA